MQALAQLPRDAARGVSVVLADIDDTLTSDGRLGARAFTAMERIRAAGLRMIPITGRPAGWCDHIARMWPVDAVVGENGAFWFRYDEAARRMLRSYVADAATRAAQRLRLEAIARRILAEVPGAAIASDQAYRESDLAIDFREDVAPLPWPQVERIAALMRAAGLTAKISSIHVNGWFGDFDKLGMTRTLLAAQFGLDIDREPARCVFAGDSPNDQPMFAFFPLSVGVANVADFTDRIEVLPAYVTPSRGGEGFAELADRLLALRVG